LLVWPLFDATGELLRAEHPWSDLHANAIARIEALGTVPQGTALVLRTRATAYGVVGEPVSLVLPGRNVDPVDALHFTSVETKAPSRWVAAMAGVAPRVHDSDDENAVVRPAIPALVDLRIWLEEQAERGTAGADPLATATTVARHHRALRAVGLHCFPELDPATSLDPADLLIRSHYLLQQVEIALT
jgi:hypothetical protein